MSSSRVSDECCFVHICPRSDCMKVFRRADRLKHHLTIHDGRKAHVCSYDGCGKSYTQLHGLKRHVETVHVVDRSNIQTFRCPEVNCDKVFKSNCNLKRHLKAHKNRQITCPHCSKTFRKRQHLKIHEFQHTGVKPFSCPHEGCSKSFLVPSKLKAHMKCHEGYKCKSEGCEQIFDKWSLLRKHVAVHHNSKHVCSTCNKSFDGKMKLKRHEETHGQTREIFPCPWSGCGRFYYFKTNLTQHINLKHKETEKYKCSVEGCSMVFTHKSSLRRHVTLHTDGAPKLTKKRVCRKRVSMAARLSGYPASKEEESKLLGGPDKQADDNIPQVVISCKGNVYDVAENESKCVVEAKKVGLVNVLITESVNEQCASEV